MIKELFALVVSFFKIGIMTFGGGYAMLPMLQRELVENRKWVTEEEILNYFAIGQCTPGVIAVNTATFVGYKRCKIPGAIFATIGVVLPSMIIITIIAAVLSTFARDKADKNKHQEHCANYHCRCRFCACRRVRSKSRVCGYRRGSGRALPRKVG